MGECFSSSFWRKTTAESGRGVSRSFYGRRRTVREEVLGAGTTGSGEPAEAEVREGEISDDGHAD